MTHDIDWLKHINCEVQVVKPCGGLEMTVWQYANSGTEICIEYCYY